MKHAANIEPSVSRSFDLPFLTRSSEFWPGDAPAFDGEWHSLPERFLEGIDFASRLLGSEVVVSDGRAFTTDNLIATEFDVGGPCQLKLTLRNKDVRAIKAFGAAPSHAFWSGIYREPQRFIWSNGSLLQIGYRSLGTDIATRLRVLLDGFDWNGLHEVDEGWRSQVAGHFAFKTARGEDGILRIHPGRIAGGIFDSRPNTELPIETFTDREVQLTKVVFLKVLKVATSIKFVYDGNRARLLFRGDNFRGVAAARYKVAS